MIGKILFPEGAVCLCCGKISDGHPLCPVCRLLLEEEAFEPDMCRMDRYEGPSWSVWPHRGRARRLVHLLKYDAVRCCAELLGTPMARLARKAELPADTTVTWVTMPKRRLRERGIDHGRLLAETVGRMNGWKTEPLLLRGDRNLVTQQGLDYAGRMKNLTDCFQSAGPVTGSILLVDDVLTTGATSELCRKLLKESGADHVTVLTATRA